MQSAKTKLLHSQCSISWIKYIIILQFYRLIIYNFDWLNFGVSQLKKDPYFLPALPKRLLTFILNDLEKVSWLASHSENELQMCNTIYTYGRLEGVFGIEKPLESWVNGDTIIDDIPRLGVSWWERGGIDLGHETTWT